MNLCAVPGHSRFRNIFVKTLSGKSIELVVMAWYPTGVIKSMLEELLGCPRHQQRLTWMNQMLVPDGYTLGQWDIPSGSTLLLVLEDEARR